MIFYIMERLLILKTQPKYKSQSIKVYIIGFRSLSGLKKFDIIGLGESCVDCLLRVSSESSSNQQPEILDWSIQGGGKVATAIVAATRLGAKTSIMTKIGDDEAGDFVISDLKKYEVNIGPVVKEKGRQTEICFIIVEEKTGNPKWVSYEVIEDWNLPKEIEYMIKLAKEQKMKRFASKGFSEEDINHVCKGEVLHIDGFFPECLSAVEIANKSNISTCYDLDTPLSQYIPRPCFDSSNGALINSVFSNFLANISFLIASKKAALKLTKEIDAKKIVENILKYGPGGVVVTLGNEGSLLMTRTGTVIEQEAFSVPVIDTTGAGDVFHGAFCYGLLKKWSLKRIMQFSSAVSAIKCTRLGGREGIPSLSDVEILLNNVKKNN